MTPAHYQTLLQQGYLEPLKEKFPQAEIRVYAVGGTTPYHQAVGALLEAQIDVNQNSFSIPTAEKEQ